MMKLAFSTNAFKKYSLQDSIRKISTIGYEGVEILADIPHAYPPMFGEEQIGSAIDTLSECKIQVSNLNAFTLYAITDVYHPSWIENDNSLRTYHKLYRTRSEDRFKEYFDRTGRTS
jgi:sugar phosphate isomerase/epimerase